MTPAKRGKGRQSKTPDVTEATPAEHRASLTWAQRLKRVFKIDIETCSQCGAAVKNITCIEDPSVIKKILGNCSLRCSTSCIHVVVDHLDAKAAAVDSHLLPESRAPPQAAFQLTRRQLPLLSAGSRQ